MDPQRNKERTLDAVAALNRGDVEGYLAIYAPGAVVHGLPEHVTPDAAGHRDVLTDIRRALPDFRAEVAAVVAEGDLLAARVTYTGTHEGTMRGRGTDRAGADLGRHDVPALRRGGRGSSSAGSSATTSRCSTSSAWSEPGSRALWARPNSVSIEIDAKYICR